MSPAPSALLTDPSLRGRIVVCAVERIFVGGVLLSATVERTKVSLLLDDAVQVEAPPSELPQWSGPPTALNRVTVDASARLQAAAAESSPLEAGFRFAWRAWSDECVLVVDGATPTLAGSQAAGRWPLAMWLQSADTTVLVPLDGTDVPVGLTVQAGLARVPLEHAEVVAEQQGTQWLLRALVEGAVVVGGSPVARGESVAVCVGTDVELGAYHGQVGSTPELIGLWNTRRFVRSMTMHALSWQVVELRRAGDHAGMAARGVGGWIS